jgi:hypothetical protein
MSKTIAHGVERPTQLLQLAAAAAMTLAFVFAIVGTPFAAAGEQISTAEDCPALLRHTFNSLQTGAPQSLCQYAGKVVVIVNTASYRGYTPQYQGSSRFIGDTAIAVSSCSASVERLRRTGTRDEQGGRRVLPLDVRRRVPDVREIAARPETQPLIPNWPRGPDRHRAGTSTSMSSTAGDERGELRSRVTPDAREFVGVIEKLLAEKPAAGKS